MVRMIKRKVERNCDCLYEDAYGYGFEGPSTRRVAKLVLHEGTRLDLNFDGLMACPERPATLVPGSRLLSRALRPPTFRQESKRMR